MLRDKICSECGQALAADTPEALCPVCALRSVAEADQNPTLSPRAAEVAGAPADAGGVRSAINLSKPAAEAQIESSRPDVSSETADRRSLILNSFGDYERLEEIARGGMGVVYRARQRSLNRQVALKTIVGGPLASAAAIQRFRAEARAAASLQHPHIVALHEVGELEGQPFFSMDYVEGRNLAQVIADSRFAISDFARSARWAKTIAEAVHYAHERGIIHRDLKPSNVLIDQFDQPRITDFGLAKRFGAADVTRLTSPDPAAPEFSVPAESQSLLTPAATDLTVSGQVLGSPNFMAPEQAQGRHQDVGPSSDVYSIGALLYHLLTGRPPFQAATLTEVLRQVVATDPAAPRLLNPSLPRDLETICLKCLEKDIPRRYPTAQALAEELGRFLRGEPILARPLGQVGTAVKWCRRNPRLAVALSAALACLVLGLAGVSWQWRRAEAQRARAEAHEYILSVNVAQQALQGQNPNPRRARELLNRYRPAGASAIRQPESATDGRWLAVDRSARLIQVWSLSGPPRSHQLSFPGEITELAFSPDGRLLAAANLAGTVRIWEVPRFRERKEFQAHARPLSALVFSPDSRRLVTSGQRDHAVKLWDVATCQELMVLRHGRPTLEELRFSGDGNQLIATSSQGDLLTWRAPSWGRLTRERSNRRHREFLQRTGTPGCGAYSVWITDHSTPWPWIGTAPIACSSSAARSGDMPHRSACGVVRPTKAPAPSPVAGTLARAAFR